MKLLQHRLTNFRGIDFFEFKPGQVSIIAAGNGKGKTTVLDSFRSLAEGGADPTSIKTGEESAEIKSIWEVHEGDPGGFDPGRYTITRTIKSGSYNLDVRGPNGKPIPKEATFVKTFLAPRAFDPLAFDDLTDKERAEELKKILCVKLEADELRKAVPLADLGALDPVMADGVAECDKLIEKFKKDASDKRSALKNRQGSIATFKETLDEEEPENVEPAHEAAKADLRAAKEALKAGEDATRKAKIDADAEALRISNAELSEINAWEFQEILKIKEAAAAKRKVVDEKLATTKDGISADYNHHVTTTVQALRDKVTAAERKIEDLAGKLKRLEQIKGAREQLAAWEKESQDLNQELEDLGTNVRGVEALKKKLLKRIPLEGFQIKDGLLYIGDVLSSKVNTAGRYFAWFELAGLFAKQGGFVISDQLEALEPGNREIVEEVIRKSGVQFIGAIRTEGPLRVEKSMKDIVVK